MSFQTWASRKANRLNPRVAKLFGVSQLPFTIDIVRKGLMGQSAEGTPFVGQIAAGNIQLSRAWLKDVGHDPGMIAHELAHLYGGDETKADAVRAELQGGTVTQPNGPRPGRTHGRNRNTLGNQSSKTTTGVGLPVVSPGSAVSYGSQEAQLTAQYLAQLALLRGQKGLVKGQFQQDRASIQQQAIGNMVGAENAAIGRGVLGSSADLGARAGVLGDKAAAMSQAVVARIQGMLGIRQSQLQAQNTYYTGLFDIEASKRAEQMAMALAAFEADKVNRPGDERAANSPTGGGTSSTSAGPTGPANSGQPYQDNQGNWIDPNTGGVLGAGPYGPTNPLLVPFVAPRPLTPAEQLILRLKRGG